MAAMLLVLVPATVFGHAELATMSPADKSTVAAPREIVATFTEPLDPAGSSLKLVDSSGKVLVQGGAIDPTDKKTMRLDVSATPIAPGSYEVRWTSKSAADGDLDRGTTTFSVPPPSVTAPGPQSSASPSDASSPSPSALASAEASLAPSDGTGTPTSSTDALIPIIVVLVVIAALGLWLLRGRGRRGA
jgi:copper resistance protein C